LNIREDFLPLMRKTAGVARGTTTAHFPTAGIENENRK